MQSGLAAAPKARNPTWNRDELILALDLYMARRGSPPGQTSPEVIELSGVLNRLGQRLGRSGDGRYRNGNGVYMKMANFMRLDPTRRAEGKVGLARGGQDELTVWNEFASDEPKLRRVATAIRSTINLPEADLPDVDDDITEAAEGRLLTRVHRRRERNRKLVEQRKQKTLKATGALRCEACTFDFAEAYGARGRGFIEAHHTMPLHQMGEGAKTRLEDLALLCSNCHRMIHSAQPWLTVGELKDILVRRDAPH